MKVLLLAITLTMLTLGAQAQDKIYTKNSGIINAKVSEINTRDIIYKRADNPNGPNYAIAKNGIEKIVYENGTQDVINASGSHNRDKTKINYGNNIIALAPLQVSVEGLGLGISYERVLDAKGFVSFYLPVIWGRYSKGAGFNNYTGNYNMYYIEPGIKFYPTGNMGKIRYAVGPSLVFAAAQRPYLDNYNHNGYYTSEQVNQLIFGVVINNSINICPTPHLYLGMELGLGLSYVNQIHSVEQGTKGLVHFGLKVGFQF